MFSLSIPITVYIRTILKSLTPEAVTPHSAEQQSLFNDALAALNNAYTKKEALPVYLSIEEAKKAYRKASLRPNEGIVSIQVQSNCLVDSALKSKTEISIKQIDKIYPCISLLKDPEMVKAVKNGIENPNFIDRENVKAATAPTPKKKT